MDQIDLNIQREFDNHDAISNVDEDIDDLFDDQVLEEREPDNDEEENENQGRSDDEAEEVDVDTLQRLNRLAKGAAKKVVRNPQPKLDANRLTGPKGLIALKNTLDNVKFKGKGHEFDDLATLVKTVEIWAHHLFPKMRFEEIVEKLEKLGKKKEIKAIMSKIRLDIPIIGLTDEIVNHADSDEEKENQNESHITFDNEAPLHSTRIDQEALFDSLLEDVPIPDDEDNLNLFRNDNPNTSRMNTERQWTSIQDLSEEEKLRRIEENRQKAMERLHAKRHSTHFNPKAGSSSLLNAFKSIHDSHDTTCASSSNTKASTNPSETNANTLSHGISQSLNKANDEADEQLNLLELEEMMNDELN